MSRTLEFDYPNALRRATRLFWQTGYANTPLRGLLQVMRIGESSFYNTLKSKKNAYLESLKHYNATVGRQRGEAFASAPTAALGVRALFSALLDCLDDPNTPSRVCMMGASITPEVWAEPELRTYVQQQLSLFSEQLSARLGADRQSGLLPPDFDPEVVAPVLLTYVQGLWRMALVAYDRPRFERQINTFLMGLGL